MNGREKIDIIPDTLGELYAEAKEIVPWIKEIKSITELAARMDGTNLSQVSDLLRGKRPLTQKSLQRLTDGCELNREGLGLTSRIWITEGTKDPRPVEEFRLLLGEAYAKFVAEAFDPLPALLGLAGEEKFFEVVNDALEPLKPKDREADAVQLHYIFKSPGPTGDDLQVASIVTGEDGDSFYGIDLPLGSNIKFSITPPLIGHVTMIEVDRWAEGIEWRPADQHLGHDPQKILHTTHYEFPAVRPIKVVKPKKKILISAMTFAVVTKHHLLTPWHDADGNSPKIAPLEAVRDFVRTIQGLPANERRVDFAHYRIVD